MAEPAEYFSEVSVFRMSYGGDFFFWFHQETREKRRFAVVSKTANVNSSLKNDRQSCDNEIEQRRKQLWTVESLPHLV